MVTLKFLKKIRDKLDDYIEVREQARENRRSYNLATSSSWSPDPFMEERTRRKSYDDKYRRHTSPDPVKCKTIVANNDSRAKKNRRSNQQLNSEDNLANPRRSREVVINQRGSGRERSPRRSDSVLLRKRLDYQGQAARLSDDNKPRASTERINRLRKNIPPLPLNPVQWAGLPRNNRPLSPQAVPHFRQQSSSITGPQEAQPPADWYTYVRGRNKKERLAAAAEIRHEEEKRREALRWKASKETRSGEEQENAAQRKREEARIRTAAEREKAEKRRKVQEAEKRASDDRVKRENERRRLLAYGPPPGESEQQPRQRTWSTPHILGDSGSQARQAERSETAPVQKRTGADNIRQLHSGQQIKNTARRNSVPITPQKKDNSVQNMPLEFTPLTEENLWAQVVFGDEDVDPLGRGLGDNMRTILEGFMLPTIFQSDLTPSDEEENPLDQK